MELSAVDYIFVGEWLSHGNACQAFRVARPDYTGIYLTTLAWQMLKKPHIQAEIKRCLAASAKKVELSVDDVMRDIKNVLAADSRDLTEYRKGACRYCHGENHLYHRTAQEERTAYILHLESEAGLKGMPFNRVGGIGYSPKADPHPECPECHGDGYMTAIGHDTRKLNEAAATLYAGTKPTAHGVEILTRSKDQARKDAAAILGMSKATLNVNHNFKAKDLDDDALARIAAGDD